MTSKENTAFIKEAIDLSRKGMEMKAGGPFGCVIVKDGEIVGRGHNEVLATNDPTAHAEIIAIREACKLLDAFHLEGCILYTSCEPCPMCLSAIYWAHISKVYYCNTREDAAGIGFDDSFIYDEIAKTPGDRQIRLEHVPSGASIQVFKDWKNTSAKTTY